MSITITEALSEINLLKKKIANAESGINSLLVRATHVEDPYAASGGTPSVYRSVWQSTQDMRDRLVKIRSQISTANNEHTITINGQSKTIFDWLTWKREIYADLERSLKAQIKQLKDTIQRESDRPEVWKDKDGNVQVVKYVRNVELKALEDQYVQLLDTYEKLDGQLSLKNATIVLN